MPNRSSKISENDEAKPAPKPRSATTRTLLEGGMAEPVIGGALVAVLQDFVGFVDFLELDFAGGIARILVRMPFHRELAERRLELAVVRGPLNLQGLVIAALGGHPSDPSEVRRHSQNPGPAEYQVLSDTKSCQRIELCRKERTLKDAAFRLTKNDPLHRDAAHALFGMGAMIATALKRISCCSCRRRPR